MSKTSFKRWLKKHATKQNYIAVIVCILFASIGAYLITHSSAAAPYVAVEAASGQLSGEASEQTDPTASDGHSVKFGISPAAVIVVAVNGNVQAALSSVTKPDTFVELDPGTWNAFTISNLTLPVGTTISMVPGQAQPTILGMTISGITNLTVNDINSPMPAQTSSEAMSFLIEGSSSNIIFQNSTLDTGNNIGISSGVQYLNNVIEENPANFVNNLSLASNADNVTISGNAIGGGARCLFIWGDVADQTNWPSGLNYTNNSCGCTTFSINDNCTSYDPVGEDDVNIDGGLNDTFTKSMFYVPQQTDGHDDGIQSEGSNDLVIQHNQFDGTPYMNCGANCPDNGVIIGDTAVNGVVTLTTTNSTVEGNIIHWRGQGIALGGTDNALIEGNTIWDNHQCLNVSPFTCNDGYSGINMDTKGATAPNGSPSLVNNDITIENNVVQSISYGALGSPPTGYTEDYNCSPNFNGYEEGSHDQVTTVDPFVDHVAYQLNDTAGGGALCRGHGLGPEPLSQDFYGVPFKNPPDIGAVQSS